MKRIVRWVLVVLAALVVTFAIYRETTRPENLRRQQQLEKRIGDWQVEQSQRQK